MDSLCVEHVDSDSYNQPFVVVYNRQPQTTLYINRWLSAAFPNGGAWLKGGVLYLPTIPVADYPCHDCNGCGCSECSGYGVIGNPVYGPVSELPL